jgi:hypothetical protein
MEDAFASVTFTGTFVKRSAEEGEGEGAKEVSCSR